MYSPGGVGGGGLGGYKDGWETPHTAPREIKTTREEPRFDSEKRLFWLNLWVKGDEIYVRKGCG